MIERLYQSDRVHVTQTRRVLDQAQEPDCIRHLWFIDALGRISLQGSCDIAKPGLPVLDYIARMVTGLPQRNLAIKSSLDTKQPPTAWVLGLGCGSIAHAILTVWSNANIHLVEIESEVMDLAQQYFCCPNDHAQWQYHNLSIQQWLMNPVTPESSPLFIALDAYTADGLGPSVGLASDYEALAKVLHPHGCLAVNLHEQHGLVAHLTALEAAFERRVKVHFVAGQGNPIAFAYGTAH